MKTVALLGNPNIGKTTIFNSLTGSYKTVGNWNGVTVDKVVGTLHQDAGLLVDLPGVYDFTPHSADEAVVPYYFLENEMDGLINVVDASHLESNLHLTIQVLEFQKPTLIALNMIDKLKREGKQIDSKKLSQRLGVPIIPTIARKNVGSEQLITRIRTSSNQENHFTLYYGLHLEKAIMQMEHLLEGNCNQVSARWLAIQYLLKNQIVIDFIHSKINDSAFQEIVNEMEVHFSKPLEEEMMEIRQKYIRTLLENCIIKVSKKDDTFTKRLDCLFMQPLLGIPIFLLTMFIIFQMTFSWLGPWISDTLNAFINGPISDGVTNGLEALNVSGFLQALIIDGIIGGVGAVLPFIPQVFILFLFISMLEDSGYMSRIAVVMDRFMERFGLNGKSFIPMIVGFGCNVPGVMSSRMIEQPNARLMTILTTPFMSCSARLPVYALFVGAFFSEYQGLVVFSLYFLGLVLSLIVAKILSMTILKEEYTQFFVELPAYNIPHAKTILRSTWEKGRGFIIRAGMVIFLGSLIFWLLSYTGPGGVDVAMDKSFVAILGGMIAPLLIPIGFGTWQAASALLTGFIVKEVVVSSMAIIYSTTEGEMAMELAKYFTPLTAYVFMVFVLLYVPCLATISVIKTETKSVKWTAFAAIYPLITAYIICLTIYQVGRLFL